MAAWYPCRLVLDRNFQLDSHPLHVKIVNTDEPASSKFLSQSTNAVVIALRNCESVMRDLNCLFVAAEIVTFNDEYMPLSDNIICDGRSNWGITVHCSQLFLDHYRLNCVSILKMKIVQPLSLDKIVIGATSDDAYLWATQNKWATELLISVCKKPTLCRYGDVVLLGWTSNPQHCLNMVTLACQPILQGIITTKTEIVVIKIDESNKKSDQYNKTHPVSKNITSLGVGSIRNKFEIPMMSTIYSNLTLMKYMGHLLCPHATNFNPVMSVITKACRIVQTAFKFKIHILPVSPYRNSNACKQRLLVDPLNVVFMTSASACKLGLCDGKWIKIMLELDATNIEGLSHNDNVDEFLNPQTKADGKKFRYAQVCCIGAVAGDIMLELFGTLNDSVVYILPHLWFNFNVHPSSLLNSDARLVIETPTPVGIGQISVGHGENNSGNDFQPQIATEVNISFIQSPYSPYQDIMGSLKGLIQKYFLIPRYIEDGDVICIGYRADVDYEAPLDNNNISQMQNAVVYFKVKSVKSCNSEQMKGYLVHQEKSTVYQTGPSRSYIPVTMDVFLFPQLMHRLWNSPSPAGLRSYVEKLQDIIGGYLNSEVIRKYVPPTILVSGSEGSGKMTIIRAVCRRLNMHIYQVGCHELLSETSSATESKLKQVISKGITFAPCILVLKNIDILSRNLHDSHQDIRVMEGLKESVLNLLEVLEVPPLIVIGTTNKYSSISIEMMEIFLPHVKVKVPTVEERFEIVDAILSSIPLGSDISSQYLVQKTAGFVLGDICALAARSCRHAYNKIAGYYNCQTWLSAVEEENILMAGVQVLKCDFDNALTDMQAAHSDAIGAPKVPNVFWDDIGGLQDVKDAILDTIQLPLQHPELLASGLRRSGVLLFGPPGTGKTLLAKAVATECSLHFLSIKGPELLDMYVGQSEENIRKVFQRARNAAPCVVFFDELDSLAPNRGRSGDAGGLMDRVVSQLLAELDGLEKSMDVFVIGATIRPDLIDPALLRPGRFDKLLYVGIADDQESQLKILRALTRKFVLAADLKLDELVKLCPPHLTGADFYALCSDAMMKAIAARIKLVKKEEATEIELIVVEKKDFEDALAALVPSVSLEEMARYRTLKQMLAN